MAHLTVSQRYTIETMLKAGHSKTEIAKTIGKDKSVVGRELTRNCDLRSGKYRHDLAQRKYEKIQKEKPKKIRFTNEVKSDVEELLRADYSPEQVVGTLKKQGFRLSVSISTFGKIRKKEAHCIRICE
ncbi:MAG: transposase, partial [Flavobacteriales bacterium]